MIFEFACKQDIDSWMKLLELVKDNFPGLDKEAYEFSAKIIGISVGLRGSWKFTP